MSWPKRSPFADDDECGLLYRTDEWEYCKLRFFHNGHVHSTREHKDDYGGFEWDATPDPNALQWPD